MSQSAEEWSQVRFYEKLADDEDAAPELRALFARKANCLRILTRLGTAGPRPAKGSVCNRTAGDREALLFSPTRLAAARVQQWRLSNSEQWYSDGAAELAQQAHHSRGKKKASWMSKVIHGRHARSAAGR